jgi:15-cis-phytoene synthase
VTPMQQPFGLGEAARVDERGPRSAASPLELAGEIRARLAWVASSATAAGLPALQLEGQLLRPLVAASLVPDGELDGMGEPFWNAVLAVQMAHEASLLHDDVIDQAATRRGRPTLAAAQGVARALVQGDHLLTGAYRLAAATGSLAFVTRFAHAVERTVAGEIEQGRVVGQRLDLRRYREVAIGKSGELLGCALAVVPTLQGSAAAEEIYRMGRRLGLVYQMLDDLLDFCPATDTGKPPLADYAQQRWTWVLAELPALEFGLDAAEVVRLLHEQVGGGSAMQRALARLETEAAAVLHGLRGLVGEQLVVEALVASWLVRGRAAVGLEAGVRCPAARTRSAARAAIESRLPETDALSAYFARGSRSFHFAARLLPAAERACVARIYAYCRMTDDLVDRAGPSPAADPEAMLEEWLRLSRQAYRGERTGFPLLDAVMPDMAERAIPFAYASELIEGMRMDLRGGRFETLDALRVYTYRVASVVGLWISELAGMREPAVLERAASLGHAMQLTNILRDVGEDWRAGRLYLPAELLDRYGVSERELAAIHDGTCPIPTRYGALLEELMEIAEQDYRRAFSAIPALPPSFQRPVAVAAGVYRGIHAEIRRHGYDNLRRRAQTSTSTKLVLAALALWELRAARHLRRAIALPVERAVRDLQWKASIATGP